MNMLERVARGICESLGHDPDCNSLGRPEWPSYLSVARAAIEAMREPTEEMAKAGGKARRQWDKSVWQAMISAALSEPHAPQA